MIVRLVVLGGFAPVPLPAREVTVDSDELSAVDREALHASVAAARLDGRPSTIDAAPGAADFRTYDLTVELSDGPHAIRFPDTADAELTALVGDIQRIARAQRDKTTSDEENDDARA